MADGREKRRVPKDVKEIKDPLSAETIGSLIDEKFSLLITQLQPHPQPQSQFEERLEGKLEAGLKRIEDILQNALLDFVKQEERITSLENAMQQKDKEIQQLKQESSATSQTLERLKFKLLDLENRSRRNNLRIIGLPEEVEKKDPIGFLSKLLGDTFIPHGLASCPVIDRAHRIYRSVSSSDGKPRPVILRLHYFQDKEKIIRLARKMGRIPYETTNFRIVEDYSPDVYRQRIAFKPIMSRIHDLGLKQVLLFPALLKVSLQNGSSRSFKTVEEARKFADDMSVPEAI